MASSPVTLAEQRGRSFHHLLRPELFFVQLGHQHVKLFRRPLLCSSPTTTAVTTPCSFSYSPSSSSIANWFETPDLRSGFLGNSRDSLTGRERKLLTFYPSQQKVNGMKRDDWIRDL